MVGLVVVTRAALLIARRASTWTIDEHLGGRSPQCVAVDRDRIRNRRPRVRLFAATGRGVRLSEDWAQAMGAGHERPAGREGHDASRFATHAGEPGVIYAANNHGVFRSDNAGRSWKALDLPWPEPGLADGVEALACLPE